MYWSSCTDIWIFASSPFFPTVLIATAVTTAFFLFKKQLILPHEQAYLCILFMYLFILFAKSTVQSYIVAMQTPSKVHLMQWSSYAGGQAHPIGKQHFKGDVFFSRSENILSLFILLSQSVSGLLILVQDFQSWLPLLCSQIIVNTKDFGQQSSHLNLFLQSIR